jgi:hypothetical protein
MIGGYTDIARALKRRGWEQSRTLDSPFFDFRFVLKGRDVAYNTILPHQIANHFQGNTEITTKTGLAHNVRAVQWLASVSQDFFFPRCYDMRDPEEYEAFEGTCMQIDSSIPHTHACIHLDVHVHVHVHVDVHVH